MEWRIFPVSFDVPVEIESLPIVIPTLSIGLNFKLSQTRFLKRVLYKWSVKKRLNTSMGPWMTFNSRVISLGQLSGTKQSKIKCNILTSLL